MTFRYKSQSEPYVPVGSGQVSAVYTLASGEQVLVTGASEEERVRRVHEIHATADSRLEHSPQNCPECRGRVLIARLARECLAEGASLPEWRRRFNDAVDWMVTGLPGLHG